MTSIEREEKEKVKKREKKLEDEETLQQATWVKYTFPIKHQVGLKLAHTHLLSCFFSLTCRVFLCGCSSCVKVWKQKGEEYRVTGYGGWSWISKTYVQRFLPRLPGNTNANYRKELEGQGLKNLFARN